MSYRFDFPQAKQLEPSLSLTDYVVNLQQHMTAHYQQEFNYQSQACLELLVSRQSFS